VELAVFVTVAVLVAATWLVLKLAAALEKRS
jgi:hypothetical protein